jgi:very-short-patch-repair endonuclease
VFEDPVDVVRRMGGQARTGDVLGLCGRAELARALTDGRLRRPARGVLVLRELPDADVAAVRVGGVLSHLTAAQRLGLSLVKVPEAVHVTVPHGARAAREAGVRVHWSVVPLGTPGRLRCTSALRTVLDCATSLPFDEALAVADSALERRLITPQELRAAAAQGSRTGRRRRLRVAASADGRAVNAFESRLRAIVLDAGLTGFEPQLEIRLTGWTLHADLADPVRRVVLEADSYAHHGARDDLRRDCERYDELVADGWRVLRFAYEHVMLRRAWVEDIVVRVCRPRPVLVTYGAAGPDVVTLS